MQTQTISVEKKKPNLEYQRKKDSEMVKGIFRFHEVPGGSMSFSYKAYKGDDVQRYDFIDGQMYSIPLGVARHLNKNCWYPVHASHMDDNGNPSVKIGKKVRRVSFQSLEFVDSEDFDTVGGSNLIEITRL